MIFDCLKKVKSTTQALIKLAEKEFGIFVINVNNPTETVSINSFLHYLFYIVIFINHNDKCILSCAINQHSKTFGLFTTMLIIFVKEFVFNMPNSQNDMLLDLMIEDNTFFEKIKKIITFDHGLTVRNIFKFLIEWKVKYDQTFIDGNLTFVSNFLYNFSTLLFFTDKLLSFEISSYLKIVFPFIERDGSVIESDYEITILDAVEIVIAIFKKKIEHSNLSTVC